MIKTHKQYIGVLSTKSTRQGNVFINKAGAIQFKIQLLNDDQGESDIGAFLNTLPEYTQIDNPDLPAEERVLAAQKWLRNRMFIFFAKELKARYASVIAISSIAKSNYYYKDTPYISVPVFAPDNADAETKWQNSRTNTWLLHRSYHSYEEWAEQISTNQPLGRIYGIDSQENLGPFVLWRESQELFAVGSVSRTNENNQIQLHGEIQHCMSIEKFRNQFIYDITINPTVAFLPQNIFNKIKDALYGTGEGIDEADECPDVNEIITEADLPFDNDENITDADLPFDNDENVTDADLPFDNDENITDADLPFDNDENITEADLPPRYDEYIIDAMYEQCINQNLDFRKMDLINFHISVKSNPFVILTGRTGSGKTTLLDIYVHALGIHPTQKGNFSQYHTIVVRPSWQNDISFFGMPDYDNGIYLPSESGFIETLIYAKQHPKQLIFLCLDGINMCQPKLYLHLFSSLLAKINLYPDYMKKHLKNSDFYPDHVLIGKNVRIIGILNETQNNTSLPIKILQHINVIHMSEQKSIISVDKESYCKLHDDKKEWTSTEYNGYSIVHESTPQLLNKIITEINEVLTSVNPSLAVTHNEKKEIIMYCKHAMNLLDNQFSLAIALDYQIAQRILTKICGSTTDCEILLGNSQSSLLYFFDKYTHFSTFDECKNIIAQKREQLKRTGKCD